MVKKGDKFLDFNLSSDQGVSVKLSEKLVKNSPLLLIFYKFNCPTCQFTFQYLPRISHAVGEGNFLAVAQDTPDEAVQFRTKYNFGIEIACDVHPYLVSSRYGIDFVPTLFVIEKDGTVSERAEGFDKKCIESFSQRIAVVRNLQNFLAFQPNEQVPLLKPG